MYEIEKTRALIIMDTHTKSTLRPLRAQFTVKPSSAKPSASSKKLAKDIRVNDFEVPYLSKKGTVLLPDGILPLHITSKKDVEMVRKALSSDKKIAIVQPKTVLKTHKALYKIGCLGVFTTYSENADGTLYVVL